MSVTLTSSHPMRVFRQSPRRHQKLALDCCRSLSWLPSVCAAPLALLLCPIKSCSSRLYTHGDKSVVLVLQCRNYRRYLSEQIIRGEGFMHPAMFRASVICFWTRCAIVSTGTCCKRPVAVETDYNCNNYMYHDTVQPHYLP
jgi:hypothetical protein